MTAQQHDGTKTGQLNDVADTVLGMALLWLIPVLALLLTLTRL